MTLKTQLVPEGIKVTDKLGNEVCLIRRTADGVYVLDYEGTPYEVVPMFRHAEFHSLESAEYAALIIHLELKATGH